MIQSLGVGIIGGEGMTQDEFFGNVLHDVIVQDCA